MSTLSAAPASIIPPPFQHHVPASPRHRPPGAPLPEARLTLDRQQLVLDASPAVQCLMGFPGALQAGRPLSEACADSGFLAAVAAGSSKDGPYRTMLVRTGLDGKTRHLSVQVVQVDAPAAQLLVLLSDASRQVQLEDELMAAGRILDVISDGVVLVDMANWRVRRVNAPALVLLGLDSAELPGLGFGRLCSRLRGGNGAEPAAEALAALVQPADYHYRRPDGAVLQVELRVEHLRSGGRAMLAVVFRDIGERLRAGAELRAASSRCGITFSQAATGLAHVTLDGRWAKVNLKLAAILGYAEDELLSLSVRELTHPQDQEADALAWRRMLDGELPYATREKRYLHKDGSEVWTSVTSSLARAEDGGPSHFICMVEDIGERKRADERIRHLASHDVLTGLPNRVGLHEHLERSLETARHAGRRLGVVFLDMDKLKAINDTHGHEAGDRALVRFARHLQGVVRSGDLVARLGGDEFVVVLGDLSCRGDIHATLQRVLARGSQAEAGTAGDVAASCSIGISIFPDDGGDARTLIRNADLAMYRAKQRGGSGFAFFSTAPEIGAAGSSAHSFSPDLPG